MSVTNLKPNIINSTAVTATATLEVVDSFSASDVTTIIDSNSQQRITYPFFITLGDVALMGDIAGRPGDSIKGELTSVSDAVVLEVTP